MRPGNNLEKCPLLPLLLHPLYGDISPIPKWIYQHPSGVGTTFLVVVEIQSYRSCAT